jgi:hypothetical protein
MKRISFKGWKRKQQLPGSFASIPGKNAEFVT